MKREVGYLVIFICITVGAGIYIENFNIKLSNDESIINKVKETTGFSFVKLDNTAFFWNLHSMTRNSIISLDRNPGFYVRFFIVYKLVPDNTSPENHFYAGFIDAYFNIYLYPIDTLIY